MKFLIQKIDGEIKHDFSFHLLKALEYQKWINSEEIEVYYDFLPQEKDPALFTPVGSVEFVQKYLEDYFLRYINPINIPPSLNYDEFLGRRIKIGMKEDILETSFIKSATKVKGLTLICDIEQAKLLEDDQFLISELIDIKSEWRGFVHNGELLDIRNYSGDPFTFPDIKKIRKMISYYSDQPITYTIDVAILENSLQTVLIEVHDFYSCGLYGFTDYRKLPIMFSQWYYEFLRKHKL